MAIASGLYKELLDGLCDGVYFVDRDRTITFWNRTAQNIGGYSEDDVLGRGCQDGVLIHVDEKGRPLCKSGCPLSAVMRDGRRRETSMYMRHKDGHMLPVLVKVNAIRGPNGKIIGGVQSFSDNSSMLAIKEKAAELEKMSLIDVLTSVGNRRYANMSLQNKLSELKRYSWSFGVLFADLDNFKLVNDTFGHSTGDEILKIVAQTMLSNLRSFDFIFRWGGDEFLVILTNMDERKLRNSAERLRIMIQNAGLRLGTQLISVTASIGGTLAKPDDTEKSLLIRGDSFMYECKHTGKNRCVVDNISCTPSKIRKIVPIK
jgi:diguanylate cyclase (GGDEF)-like protein/PAS domain S-box-containing protein